MNVANALLSDRRPALSLAGRWLALLIIASLFAACAEDPQYLRREQVLEVDGNNVDPALATDSIDLPVRLETEDEAMERAEFQELAGDIPVPLLALEDMSLSIEWTLKNLSDQEGTARIHINGSTESATYVPLAFVIDPLRDDEPPPLIGDSPITVPANAVVTGVFREDQTREAAIDISLIGDAALNPFAAILQEHDFIDDLVGDGGPLVLPAELRDRAEELIPHMVGFDLLLESNRHMILEYTVRVRDHSDMLHELLLEAPTEELTGFSPAAIAPPAEALQ